MVTPLMLLMSSINEKFEFDKPVDTMYLSRSDRDLVVSEADRLGRMSKDDSIILTTEDVFGNTIVDTAQAVNGRIVEISLATAMILTRIREAHDVYSNVGVNESADIDGSDLGTDSVIMRIEGNPHFVYTYVYNLMTSTGIDYTAKINKIAELYTSIITHLGVSHDDASTRKLVERFSLQSNVQFWQELIMSDMLKHGYTGNVVSAGDIKTVKDELRSLGFYGFVNPLKMYLDFSGARVTRKVDVNVDENVVAFLEKIVKSGGA